MKATERCIVCIDRRRVGHLFCRQCGRSYDRMANNTGDVAAVVEWTARRAHYFARQRHHIPIGVAVLRDILEATLPYLRGVGSGDIVRRIRDAIALTR